MTRDRAMALAIAAAALLTALLFAAGVVSPLRAALATVFLLVGPGLAMVLLLRLAEPLLAITLAVAGSLALETVVATALLATGVWTPGRALAAVVVVTLAVVALHLSGGSPRRLATVSEDQHRDSSDTGRGA